MFRAAFGRVKVTCCTKGTNGAGMHQCPARHACTGVELQVWLQSNEFEFYERTSMPLPSWFLISAGCATWRCTMLLPCGLRSLLLSYLQQPRSVCHLTH